MTYWRRKMQITVKMVKENEDGSAICTLDCDKEAVHYLIGEGFLTVLKRAIETSESHIETSAFEGFFEQDEDDFDDNWDDEEERLLGDMTIAEFKEWLKDNK